MRIKKKKKSSCLNIIFYDENNYNITNKKTHEKQITNYYRIFKFFIMVRNL